MLSRHEKTWVCAYGRSLANQINAGWLNVTKLYSLEIHLAQFVAVVLPASGQGRKQICKSKALWPASRKTKHRQRRVHGRSGLTTLLQSWSRVGEVPFSAAPQFSAVKSLVTTSSYRVPHYPGVVRGPTLVRRLSSGKAGTALVRDHDCTANFTPRDFA